MRDAPLRECLLLLTGLGLLAWPLRLVTAQSKSVLLGEVVSESEDGRLVTDVMVRSAHPFLWMELRRGDEVLGRLDGPETSGEFECLLAEHGERLVVAAEFAPGVPETALHLELWAGAMPEVVWDFWIEGDLLEEVEVSFHE